MATRANRGRLLIDRYDFSLDTFAATWTTTVEPLESANWQSTTMQYQPDAVDASLTMTGYYTGYDAGDIYREIYARRNTDTTAYVAWLLDTSALGQPVYLLQTGWASSITVDTPVQSLLRFDATFDGVPYGGYTLLDGQRTATGNGTVVTLPATGTSGGRAFLLVRAITGAATNAEVHIECDTVVGMTTPTDIGTITFSTVGAYPLAIAGTVEPYVRIVVDDLGGATNFTAALILCVNGVTM